MSAVNGVSGFRRGCAMWRVQRCSVEGCVNLTSSALEHCQECSEQIAALHVWAAARDPREPAWKMAFFRACRAVRFRLWIPLALGVGAALFYLGTVCASAVAEWIAEGGMQP